MVEQKISLNQNILLNQKNIKRIEEMKTNFKQSGQSFNLVNFYKFDSHPYGLSDLTILPCQTVPDSISSHCLSCSTKEYESEKQVGVIMNSGLLKNTILYYVVYENYIIRFVINPKLNLIQKLVLIYFDSMGKCDFLKNILHLKKHGCFCLGIPE